MPDILGRDDLADLVAYEAEPCVSIFLPLHRFGVEMRQNSLVLKGLLRSAEVQLRDRGFAKEEVEAILAPIEELVESSELWVEPCAGLALFAAPGVYHAFGLDVPPKEAAIVSDRFTIRPLLPLLEADGRFYILALSIRHVRLLEADRHGVRSLDLPKLPANMRDALGSMEYYSELQVHSASPAAALGRRKGVVHGHGDSDEEHFKRDLLNYFRKISDALRHGLADRDAPLVLAAVDEYLPLYRTASGDPRLLETPVHGNPDFSTDEELRQKAWPIVEPKLLEEREHALERFAKLRGGTRTSTDLAEIVFAAREGRVETLFVDAQAERWGSCDPVRREARIHVGRAPGDEELLERAAVDTLTRGGVVHAVPPSAMPVPSLIAATLRF
jgi:hypothetical protein